MSPGANGKTKISFVWNPAAVPPGARGETPARVSLIAGGANSDLYYRGTALSPGRVEFDVPPGPIDLEIAVEDANREVIDRETRQIVVPSLGLGLTFSTPEVYRARTLPEFRALTTSAGASAGHRAGVPAYRPAACSASACRAPPARPPSLRAC